MSGPEDTPPRDGPAGRGQFAEALSAALDARGMTSVELLRRLRSRGHQVSPATVSYWRTGQRQPEGAASLEALEGIEEILEVEPGLLRGAVGPSRRPGPRQPDLSLGQVTRPDMRIDDVLADMGLQGWAQMLCEDSVHVTVDVDGTGSMTHHRVRTLYRCLTRGAHRVPVVVFAGQPTLEPLVLESVSGAEAVAHLVREDVGLAAWELRLPKPLEVGETALVETRIRLADIGEPDTEYIHHAVRRLTELTVWLRFSPERLPRRCERMVHPVGEPPGRTPIDVSHTHNAHVAVRAFGPGRAGILCEW